MNVYPASDVSAPVLSQFAKLPRWVRWRKLRGKKLCFNPHAATAAKVNDPATWGTRAEASAHGEPLGFVLGDLPDGTVLCGIDLDDGYDGYGPNTLAAKVLDALGTYAEVSSSQAGLKAYFLVPGDIREAVDAAFGVRPGRRNSPRRGLSDHGEGFEYSSGKRWFSTTDDPAPGYALPIAMLDMETVEKAAAASREFPVGVHGGARGGTDGKDMSGSGALYGVAASFVHKGDEEYGAYCEAAEANEDAARFLDKHDAEQRERQLARAWDHARERITEEREGQKGAFKSYGPAEPEVTSGSTDDATDDTREIAERDCAHMFAARFNGAMLFDHDTRHWYENRGSHWRKDKRQRAFEYAGDTAEAMSKADGVSATLRYAAKRSGFASGVERIACALPGIAVTSDDWDRDPWLLGTPGGTVDLRTGNVIKPRPSDKITRVTAVEPWPAGSFDVELAAPVFHRFLNDVTCGDSGLQRYLKRLAGYCLTGTTREEQLTFVYGPGGNGKSKFIGALSGMMGDYAQVVPVTALMASHNEQHPTSIAALKGARFVTTSEIKEGSSWNEPLIKLLTGGDTIRARFMRQDEFEFRPILKLLVFGNHQPDLKSIDDGLKRRFHIVPFNFRVTPENKDDQLEEKLKDEWSAILRWAIEGCLDWQQHGLIKPKIVEDETAAYFKSQDSIAQWLDDECECVAAHGETNSDLYNSFYAHAQFNGNTIVERGRAFANALRRHGFDAVQNVGSKKERGFTGIRLRGDAE